MACFYHFFDFADFASHRTPLRDFLLEKEIKGTILLASEGINGTVAGSRESIDALLTKLRSLPGLGQLVHKESLHNTQPFQRTKVRLKKETIAFGKPIAPEVLAETYRTPRQWNDLIQSPDVLVLDTRNDYEVELGSFQGAVDPKIPTFKALVQYVEEHLDPAKHTKIATYCTGGIRCEKFASYLKSKGFPEVYQLQGGILKYLEEIPDEESLWKGHCFVFDERVGVGHGLKAITSTDSNP
ncbi:rhodanese-related sulfurtransferase [Telmatocola sphagniphila]|uniref:tRNA uridine(34) hydroxylase n=1 Tax=Telmatocola sphagniphila TaxID=1123043 RepID=A0A8E6B2P2_9BACT|nr:rhodanese-related sulfurtransferase [Telmatocola sphagniphila]QVL30601.1 rhodanese-related sulfurtransferase [Telmatocola sphagniphila]